MPVLQRCQLREELTVFYILVGTKRLLHQLLAPLVQLMLKLEGIFQLMPRGDRYLSVNSTFSVVIICFSLRILSLNILLLRAVKNTLPVSIVLWVFHVNTFLKIIN